MIWEMLSQDCNHSGFQAVGALFLIAPQQLWQERNGVKTVGRKPNIVRIGRCLMSELTEVIPRIKRPPLKAGPIEISLGRMGLVIS